MTDGNKQKDRNCKDRKMDMLFNVTESCGLLNFLIINISGKSRNNIKSLLQNREVKVDGFTVTRYDYILQIGQKVCVSTSKSRLEKHSNELDIIFEDDDFIVINKPAGLLTVASNVQRENTAYKILTDYFRIKDPKNRIYVVHRLDRDTSGVLVFSKNEKIKLALQDNWADLVLDRAYVDVVEGKLENKSGRIHSWLKQTKTMLMYSSHQQGEGLEAVTNYCMLKENDNYSMLDIHLETGRKNQIRVHMKDIGHSVVGDKKYGAKTNPMNRLGLHACKLEFKHPFSNKIMSFEAPVPQCFNVSFKKNN